MPQTVSVEVPTVDDIKENVSDAVEAVENDVEATVEKSRLANTTTTQKVLLGVAAAGVVAYVVKRVRVWRRSVKVLAEDLETGEVVEGILIPDED